MNTSHRSRRLALAAAVALAACGGAPRYVHPGLDAGTLKRVAVLPFENLTADRAVGEKAQRLLVLELLAQGGFEVVEGGAVLRVLGVNKIENPSALTPDDLKKLGKVLEADGLFFGSVLDFTDGRGGASAGATIQLRLADVGSGRTVWSTRATRGGTSLSQRLFGVGESSSTEVLAGVIHDAIGALP